jgi:hypothetical protein
VDEESERCNDCYCAPVVTAPMTLRLAALRALHFVRFVDVIAAADVVVTKPGYGTVSELILNQVPSLWVSRPGFAEEPILGRRACLAHAVTEQIDCGRT